MIKKSSLGLIILFCISSIVFADAIPEFDITKYDSLYKEGQYETIINELSELFKSYTEWIGPQVTEDIEIHARNLLADSYRMTGKYTQASIWYVMTIEGFFDSYAEYCFELMKRSATITGIKPKYRQSIPFLYYDGRLGANPSREKTLIRILAKLFDDTSLVQKKQYFKEMASYDKNNDWVTQLTKFCSGNLSLEKLWPSIPKEFIGTVSTYAGLSYEVSGDKTKARDLYQKALAQKGLNNIELLLAANKLGLFSLKIIYTTSGSPGYEFIRLTDVHSIKTSTAKFENNRLYSVQNLIDNDPKTVWVPESKKSGIGEWIEFSFDDPIPVTSINLVNGYAKSDTTFKNNNRIKTVTLEFSDGNKEKISLKDTMEPQTIEIGKTTQKVRVYIDEVYKGTKYDDTCLSEFDVKFETSTDQEDN
ncbi:MAG: hypothetical protein K6U80_20285 [Firmicutes bacterium]|nr:hypothetical protein [Bacillota bacterium]